MKSARSCAPARAVGAGMNGMGSRTGNGMAAAKAQGIEGRTDETGQGMYRKEAAGKKLTGRQNPTDRED